MSRLQDPQSRGVALLCALCTAAVLVLHTTAPFRRMEYSAADLATAYCTSRATPDPSLVYLALDDPTMNVSGTLFPDDIAGSPALQRMASGWPWPRDTYALIIDRLMQAGAKVVALDILFPIPRDGDPALKAALDKYRGRVVIGSNFADEPIAGSPRSYTLPARDIIADPANDDRVGYVNFWPDADGIIRKVKYRMTQFEAFQSSDNGNSIGRWPPVSCRRWASRIPSLARTGASGSFHPRRVKGSSPSRSTPSFCRRRGRRTSRTAQPSRTRSWSSDRLVIH